MFSRSHLLRNSSVFSVFLKILKDSKVFSTGEHPDVNKPAWTLKRVEEIFNTLPPEKVEELERAALFENENNFISDEERKRMITLENQHEKELEEAEFNAYCLTRPEYVTSFQHFVTLNYHRVKNGKVDNPQRNFVLLTKLFEKEKEKFKVEQLADLAKRRKVAEAWAERARLGLHDDDDDDERKTESTKAEGKTKKLVRKVNKSKKKSVKK